MMQLLVGPWKLARDPSYFAEDMLRDRQPLLSFDLIRSNPKICGYNPTGMPGHALTGEGLWTFWREWKPGIADALADGWAPLRWCCSAHFTIVRVTKSASPRPTRSLLASSRKA